MWEFTVYIENGGFIKKNKKILGTIYLCTLYGRDTRCVCGFKGNNFFKRYTSEKDVEIIESLPCLASITGTLFAVEKETTFI